MADKPHAVCLPSPFQSHINSMFKFAKLLHRRGFHITFVNTEFNHKRFLESRSSDYDHDHDDDDGTSSDFRFETIPDGLDPDSPRDPISIIQAARHNLLAPFTDLVVKLKEEAPSPPVTCIISDVTLPFTVTAAHNLGGIPLVMLVTLSACAFMVFKQFPALVENGLIPLKDESLLTPEYLDRVIDWIPGMNGISIRHLQPDVRQTNLPGWWLDNCREVAEQCSKASAIVFLTIDALEQQVLDAFSPMFQMYTIAPLQLLLNQQQQEDEKYGVNCSLLKEDDECLEWLDSKKPNSVVYVSFGSCVSFKKERLIEFGMGLTKTGHTFLWIVRTDMVIGESSLLPSEFLEEVKDRSFVANWCPQEKVLNHPSIGCFVTHCGWGSTMESICAGVPMICWPQLADQHTSCKYTCNEWGIGMEIAEAVERDDVERVVKEMMGTERGMKMKERAMEWKKLTEEAVAPNGSSSTNLDKLVKQLLC